MFKTKGIRNNLSDNFQEDDIEKSLMEGDEFFTKTSLHKQNIDKTNGDYKKSNVLILLMKII